MPIFLRQICKIIVEFFYRLNGLGDIFPKFDVQNLRSGIFRCLFDDFDLFFNFQGLGLQLYILLFFVEWASFQLNMAYFIVGWGLIAINQSNVSLHSGNYTIYIIKTVIL